MSDTLKSMGFAVLTAVVCSLLLTAAATGLNKYKLRNVALDRQKNILRAVGLLDDQMQYGPEDIADLYTTYIECLWVDAAGNIVADDQRQDQDLPLCLYKQDQEIVAYVIPINTRGLWGKINGYLALENDGSTVTGFTVYQHNETPGLGGEIETAWFQKNFKGKKIIGQDGDFISIKIAKGPVSASIPEDQQQHYVDGISGATLTGKYLTTGFENILSAYEPVSIRFRNNQMSMPRQPDSGA
jgi:Na+-transporting NADH:ubiquinone oxidoreductase subunit C